MKTKIPKDILENTAAKKQWILAQLQWTRQQPESEEHTRWIHWAQVRLSQLTTTEDLL